ncbi:hypothetical protein SOASR032_16420 [Pragia fontium]|uniref:MATE efflux family protein n=2 Tax=Pragia fontium TaxID=82985 RepID=A0ABQ5LHJ1_9GAMM|nr:MATE family Na+-driven efflux transporter [Pragia fontium]GKX63073.1 hypothetical protein SOASR032_16420 [Pragia fontium]
MFFAIYVLLSVGIVYFSDALLNHMQLSPELHTLTKTYISLEVWATALSSIYLFSHLVLCLLNAQRYIYYLLIIQVLLHIVFDTFWVSTFAFSLQLGVNGIAYTNIVVNVVLIFVSLLFIKKLRISFSLQHWKRQWIWLKNWGKNFLLSGGESLVRNIVFILMILRMVNSVQGAGTYWLANQFIWSWLLLPLLALSTLIKIDVAESKGRIEDRLKGYFIISTIFIMLWFMTLPLWPQFLKNIMNIEQYESVLSLLYLLVGFYIFFAYKLILESYFYGLGKINLMFYQTLIVNIVYYGGAYLLYLLGYLQFNLTTLAYLFGGGLVFSAFVTLWLWFQFGCYRLVWRTPHPQ